MSPDALQTLARCRERIDQIDRRLVELLNERTSVAEEIGRALAPVPFSSTVYLAVEALLLAGEREAQLRSALAELPAEQATIIRLSFFDEKPQSEIARELRIPLGTVKSRVRLAMTHLRAVLDDIL